MMCPSPEQLEHAVIEAASRSASDLRAVGVLTDDLRGHLASCPACAELAGMMSENARFLARCGDQLVEVAGAVRKLGDGSGSGAASGTRKSGEAVLQSAPQQVPGYELIGEIARGGQGVVYEATELSTKRRVALKLILAGKDAHRQRRVVREAELAASLRHPGIVSIYQFLVLADGWYALAMEYVEGVLLSEWSAGVDAAAIEGKEGHLAAVRRKVAALATVCDAVHHAHVNGVIHRDLKPANVLVSKEGVPRVVDFGIATRAWSQAEVTRLTRAGGFAGTLAYAAPEQVSGDADQIDTRCDVYALGLMLFEMLCGRKPYDTEGSLSGAIVSITQSMPGPMRSIRPGNLPAGAELEAIVRKALAKDRAQRYQTAALLSEDLHNWLSGRAVQARDPSAFYVVRTLARKHRGAFAAGAAAIVMLACFAAFMAWSAAKLGRERELLAAALASSNVERGRAAGVAGVGPRAESLIWPELLRAGFAQSEPKPDLVVTAQPGVMAPLWALIELYSTVPTLAIFQSPVDTNTVRFDADKPVLHIMDGYGRDERRGLPGGELIGPLLGDQPKRVLPSTSTGKPITEFASGPTATMGVATAVTAERHLRLSNSEQFVTRRLGAREEVMWDAATGERLNVGAAAETGSVVDVLTDINRLLVLDGKFGISLWAIGGEKPLAILTAEGHSSARPRFTRGGKFVAGAMGDLVKLWSAEDGTEKASFTIPPEVWAVAVRAPLLNMVLRANGRDLAVAFHTRALVFDVADPSAPPRTMGTHRGFINWVQYSVDGAVLATSGSERDVRFWDAGNGELISSHTLDEQLIGNPAISSDGKYAAVCDAAGKVTLLEVRPRAWFVPLVGAKTTVHMSRFSPDDRQVATVSSDGALRLYERATGFCVRTVQTDTALEAVCFAPDGGSVLVGGEKAPISRIELSSGKITPLLRGPDRVTWVGFGNQGRTIIVVGDMPVVALYDAVSGEATGTLVGHTQRVVEAAVTGDGKMLVTVSLDGACILWDLESKRRIRDFGPMGIATRAVAISHDGSLLATGSDDLTIRLFELSTGRLVRMFSGSKQQVFGLRFHPAGRLLFSCSRDAAVQVWDVQTGRELATLRGHGDLVFSVAISADGRSLTTASSDKRGGLWDLTYYWSHIAGNLESQVAKAR